MAARSSASTPPEARRSRPGAVLDVGDPVRMAQRSSDPTSRALHLLSLLQIHRFWPGDELADRLGVSARTLRRDVERLRELGYDVDATPGAAGGYRLRRGAACRRCCWTTRRRWHRRRAARRVGRCHRGHRGDQRPRAGEARAAPPGPPPPPGRCTRRADGVAALVRRRRAHLPRDAGPAVDDVSGPRAGAVRLRRTRQRGDTPTGGTAPARLGRSALVPGRVRRPPRRLADLPAGPHRRGATSGSPLLPPTDPGRRRGCVRGAVDQEVAPRPPTGP